MLIVSSAAEAVSGKAVPTKSETASAMLMGGNAFFIFDLSPLTIIFTYRQNQI